MTSYTHWFIRARLKTRQLLLLQALAEEGNIHGAARVMSMTQPAASKLLKDLEDVLGVELFERLPRGMRPTWYGESMIRHARMALASLNRAHDEVEALRAGRFGQVSVGAITAPGITLLPAAVAQVKTQHPSLRVSLQIETSDVLLERIAQDRLDMMIGRLFERHDKSDLRYEAIAEEPVCAMVRTGHPLLGVSRLTLRDLVSVGWIVPPAGSVLRHRWELMFQEEGLDAPENLIETNALLFITRMLRQSDLVTVLAADVANYYAGHGVAAILPIELPCKMDAFGLITRTDRLLSPAATVMLQAIKQAVLNVYGVKLSGVAPALGASHTAS
jgi:DNA-binding transcriptional LysR family regulator